jgi:hypothetical protein
MYELMSSLIKHYILNKVPHVVLNIITPTLIEYSHCISCHLPVPHPVHVKKTYQVWTMPEGLRLESGCSLAKSFWHCVTDCKLTYSFHDGTTAWTFCDQPFALWLNTLQREFFKAFSCYFNDLSC